MNYEPGLLVADRYLLEEVIATGGMGQVWRATDQTLGRAVAVKVLRPDTADDAGFVERFRAEARHSAALQHPNIATVHDFGEGAHSAYLVMELIEGKPLSTVIRERAPLPAEEVTEILYQAAIALQAAHNAGVVHRDVKPANILVDDDGYARLTDFGISRALAGASLTQTGEVLGTPHYLAPEQAQGKPAGPASDVYALAVVGYEMLTGTRPFAGDSMITTALAHVSQPAPPLPESVPEPLSTTVMAGLAKDPNQRPESAAAFAEALRLPEGEAPAHLTAAAASAVTPVVAGIGGLLTPDPQGATALIPMSPVTPAIPATTVTTFDTARRRRRMLLGGAAGLAALVLVLVIAFASVGQAKADTTPAPQATRTPTAPATAATTGAPRPSATTARPVNAATAKAPAAPAPAPAPAPKAAHAKGKAHGGGKKR
ncbi:MAG TPA: serine/threonine-protein kinase [Pedococcus sp.]|nr:serine/threonine-protein kinase [Pedococcus sp.]